MSIVVRLRTKFMLSERGRKTDAPRYVLPLTYRKIMEKFLVLSPPPLSFFSFSFFIFFIFFTFFLERSQYDKRGPSYVYLYVSAKILEGVQ